MDIRIIFEGGEPSTEFLRVIDGVMKAFFYEWADSDLDEGVYTVKYEYAL